MSYTVLLHILNEEPILAEVEKIPSPSDQILIITDPRRRDGREVSYLIPEASSFVFPWSRIHCVEVFSGETEDDIASFVRE